MCYNSSLFVPLFSVLLVCIMSLLKGASGACPGNPNRSVAFFSIPETDYDRNYSSITSDGKRPLGFQKAIWHYNQDDNPCINITGARSRGLEIMFQTFPPSRLCVMLNGQDYCSEPATGNMYQCQVSSGDTVYLEFMCDSQCAETDVQFWYRIVLGDPAELDPEQMWCMNRDKDEYPEKMRQLPPDFPMNTQATKPINIAGKHSASIGFFLSAAMSVVISQIL